MIQRRSTDYEKFKLLKISVLLEINATPPRRPIPVSGDHVSSADDKCIRKICSPDHWLKCDLGVKIAHFIRLLRVVLI